MIKKMMSIILTLSMIYTPSLSYAQASDNSVQLYINETPTNIKLMTKVGTVYVPFREFIEQMGDKATYLLKKEISALMGESTFIFYPNDGYISGSGDYYELQRPGIQIHGKFYLPICFVAWLTKHTVQTYGSSCSFNQRKFH